MNDSYCADFYVQFIISGLTTALDCSIAVCRWCHVNSDVEFWAIQPCDIKVQQHDLQMLLFDINILRFLTVQEGVVDLINKQISFLML